MRISDWSSDVCSSDLPLVLTDAVHVGGVEEVDADVQRVVEHREIGGLLAADVEVGHDNAAQADGGHVRALAASGPEWDVGVHSCLTSGDGQTQRWTLRPVAVSRFSADYLATIQSGMLTL